MRESWLFYPQMEFSPNLKNSYINQCHYFIITNQITNNFRFISNLQHRVSEHPPSLPCYEEELAILFSPAQLYQRDNSIATSQIAYSLRFISNLQYRLSEHPPSSICCEEDVAILFPDSIAAQTYKIYSFINMTISSSPTLCR